MMAGEVIQDWLLKVMFIDRKLVYSILFFNIYKVYIKNILSYLVK